MTKISILVSAFLLSVMFAEAGSCATLQFAQAVNGNAASSNPSADHPTAVIPPVPLTSHAVGADDVPVASIRVAEMGVVGVSFEVREDGSTDKCMVIRTSNKPRLDAAACVFVTKKWKFTPPMQDGSPVPYEMTSDVNFTYRRIH